MPDDYARGLAEGRREAKEALEVVRTQAWVIREPVKDTMMSDTTAVIVSVDVQLAKFKEGK
jgi:hypothetical protein